jgi:hypothetical protein
MSEEQRHLGIVKLSFAMSETATEFSACEPNDKQKQNLEGERALWLQLLLLQVPKIVKPKPKRPDPEPGNGKLQRLAVRVGLRWETRPKPKHKKHNAQNKQASGCS